MRRVVNTVESNEIDFEEILTTFSEEEMKDFNLGLGKGKAQIEKEWPDPKQVIKLPERGDENYAFDLGFYKGYYSTLD